ncbi:hypothetical protein AGMMS49545_01070 [Betaproteobacteria bacterium]|nr:hypothetical protein AGMMS49545_01070 [Betaproteobacteria bacterium]GHU48480.1 hypothetical protein AGMMS50289_25110 [Betaproteobacteria bacterium]
MPHKPSAAPASGAALTWRTRESSRHLLMAMVYSLAIAGATGVLLLLPLRNEHLTLMALVAHLTSGALAFMFFIPFLFIHLKDGREPLVHIVMPWRLLHTARRHEPLYHRLLGYALMWCLLLVFLSGLAIAFPALAYLANHPMTLLPYGGHALLLLAHSGVSLLILPALLFHFPKRALS